MYSQCNRICHVARYSDIPYSPVAFPSLQFNFKYAFI